MISTGLFGKMKLVVLTAEGANINDFVFSDDGDNRDRGKFASTWIDWKMRIKELFGENESELWELSDAWEKYGKEENCGKEAEDPARRGGKEKKGITN